jgi:hypothetical protein
MDYVAKPFERDELIGLCNRAEELAHKPGTDKMWVRAYQALADAADRLDAMLERAKQEEGEDWKEGDG